MRVAVVGGGISGLTAVWLLNEYSEHDVDMFEANEDVGGHTNTVAFKGSAAFLEILGVECIASSMSFSVKRAFGPAYEWSGNGVASLFAGI
ncbi:hypothetical protein PCANC_00356 [Puccinia coronata f. sp. avenae]|uniref:Amine oxidase domain-containing protein n=1 Tax=Puccinia coronata f. sp. avenae TaxID=200324 RepID=A0A2N5W9D6_9BASI|nr:hypothetical protein PCANC_00356 [Puccinia coronata f. sp. avenae]